MADSNTSAAESDAEGGEDSRVDLSAFAHKERRVKTSQTAVRLRELVRFFSHGLPLVVRETGASSLAEIMWSLIRDA